MSNTRTQLAWHSMHDARIGWVRASCSRGRGRWQSAHRCNMCAACMTCDHRSSSSQLCVLPGQTHRPGHARICGATTCDQSSGLTTHAHGRDTTCHPTIADRLRGACAYDLASYTPDPFPLNATPFPSTQPPSPAWPQIVGLVVSPSPALPWAALGCACQWLAPPAAACACSKHTHGSAAHAWRSVKQHGMRGVCVAARCGGRQQGTCRESARMRGHACAMRRPRMHVGLHACGVRRECSLQAGVAGQRGSGLWYSAAKPSEG